MTHQTCAPEEMGYRLHPDVVWIPRPDGSSRLMHMGGSICAIDSATTGLLTAILKLGPECAVSELAARCGIADSQVCDDILAFLSDLHTQNLIQFPHLRDSLTEAVRDRASLSFGSGMLRLINRVDWNLRAQAWMLLWMARWTVALFGWSRAVRVWEHVYPQPVADLSPSADTLGTLDHVVRQTAACSLSRIQCKERALACIALARGRGIPARLIVGITYDPLEGHVWVESEGRIISDNPEHCRLFEPDGSYG